MEVWVESLRRASVTFGYEIRCAAEERLILTAEVELACAELSGEALKVCPLPAALESALSGE